MELDKTMEIEFFNLFLQEVQFLQCNRVIICKQQVRSLIQLKLKVYLETDHKNCLHHSSSYSPFTLSHPSWLYVC